MTRNELSQMEHRLDQLAIKGAKHLRHWAAKLAVEQAWRKTIPATVITPILVLITTLAGSLFLGEQPLTVAEIVLASLLMPVAIFIALFAYYYSPGEIDRRVSLAVFDQQLGYKDRLQTADEFLKQPIDNAFADAAIHDARDYIKKAEAASLPKIEISGPKLGHDYYQLPIAGVVALVISILVHGWSLDFSGTDTDLMDQELVAANDKKMTDGLEETIEPQQEIIRPDPTTNSKSSGKKAKKASADEQSGKQQPAGNPKAASAAEEQNASSQQNKSSNSGQGNSAMSSASKKQDQKKQKTQGKQKKKTKQSDAERKEQEKNQAAGVASGKGNSSGQNPAHSDKEAAREKANQEDESDNVDEGEEEEDEEQEASNVSKPSRNKRKAPVDRKLGISGQSDQENDDANGRGGPGGLKKTRGVAAMLLGVPMPDRLQGTPNPGRTKSIQEQSQPEVESSAQVVAASRGVTNGPVGQVTHKGLLPWLTQVVEDYFVSLRKDQKSQQTSQNTTSNEAANNAAQ